MNPGYLYGVSKTYGAPAEGGFVLVHGSEPAAGALGLSGTFFSSSIFCSFTYFFGSGTAKLVYFC